LRRCGNCNIIFEFDFGKGEINVMRIRDFINVLSEYDQDVELVINTKDGYFSPQITKEVVTYKHNYNGVTYKDDAIVLSN
jgi:5,10-methylenetetrahydrofolate reductase